MRRAGASLAEIGARFGIPRQRVWQLLRRAAADAEAREHAPKVRGYARTHPGASLAQIALAVGLPDAQVAAALGTEAARRRTTRSGSPRRFSPEQCLAALRAAQACSGGPLTRERYDQLRRDGRVEGPSGTLLVQRYGTWIEALQAAGLTAVRPARPHRRRWTREQMLDAVAEFLRTDTSGTASGYDAWRLEHAPAAPSGQSIRIRCGSWSAAKEEALRLLASRRVRMLPDGVDTTPPTLTLSAVWALHRAFDVGGATAVADPASYERVRRRQDPSAKRLVSMAGTWGRALTAAGIDPAKVAAAYRTS